MATDRRVKERRRGHQGAAREQRQTDRRKGPRRVDVRVPVDLWIKEGPEGNRKLRHAGDLSLGGFYLDHTVPIRWGSQTPIQFNLPGDAKPIDVLVEVVGVEIGSKRLGMHLRFLNLRQEDHKRIKAYIDSHK